MLEDGIWGSVGGRKGGGKVFLICQRWGQRLTGDQSKCSEAELGMRLGSLELEQHKGRCGTVFSFLVALGGAALGLTGGVYWIKGLR